MISSYGFHRWVWCRLSGAVATYSNLHASGYQRLERICEYAPDWNIILSDFCLKDSDLPGLSVLNTMDRERRIVENFALDPIDHGAGPKNHFIVRAYAISYRPLKQAR